MSESRKQTHFSVYLLNKEIVNQVKLDSKHLRKNYYGGTFRTHLTLSYKLFSSPATILSRRALEAGLNQSLFERLYKLFKYDLNNPIRMLNIVIDTYFNIFILI